jgi:hypothetical protein
MKRICIEMPVVAQCMVNECAYNANSGCNARAITIGDEHQPGCDTFMAGSHHASAAGQAAGIGACKTVGCKFNDDLECMAESVQVGIIKNDANCMTFALR